MHLHLTDKFFRVFERVESVRESAAEEFHTSRVGELFKELDKFGHIELQLFNGCSGDRDCAFKLTVALLNHFEKSFSHGYVACLGKTRHDFVVGKIVIVVMVVAYVEESIAFQAERLVNLKIETN